MKIQTSLQDIKKELQEQSPAELRELCLTLARYKKDNKEYLEYLLFRAAQPENFIKELKELTDLHFSEIRTERNAYFIRKSLRKLLRHLTRYGRYMNDKRYTAEILIYFCKKVREANIPLHKSVALENVYVGQIKKIEAAISKLHEDYKADYERELEKLRH